MVRISIALALLAACSSAPPPSTQPVAPSTAMPASAPDAPSAAASDDSNDACQTCSDQRMPVSTGAPDYSVSAQKNLDRGSAALDDHDVPLGMKYLAFVKARYPSEAAKVAAIVDAHLADLAAFHDRCLATCSSCASECDVASWCPEYCHIDQ